MAKTEETQRRKKLSFRPVASVALAGILLTASVQPTYALGECDGCVVAAVGAASSAITFLLGLIETGISGGFASLAAGQVIQSKNKNMVDDQLTANAAYENRTVYTSDRIFLDHYKPPEGSLYNFSLCAQSHALSDRTAAEQDMQSLAHAMTTASNIVPPPTPKGVAERFCKDKDFNPPADGDDPEAKLVRLANCSGTTAAYARQDRNLASLLNGPPYQYPAPPDMEVPKISGAYKPFPSPMSSMAAKYVPTYAALAFCRNVTPDVPPLPAAGDQATPGSVAAVARRAAMEARNSGVNGTCWKLFTERLQIGNNVSAYKDTHDKQVKACRDDFKLHVISQATLDDCIANGRSVVQAKYDQAHRLENPEYMSKLLASADTNTQFIVITLAQGETSVFDASRAADRNDMISAMSSVPGTFVSQIESSNAPK